MKNYHRSTIIKNLLGTAIFLLGICLFLALFKYSLFIFSKITIKTDTKIIYQSIFYPCFILTIILVYISQIQKYKSKKHDKTIIYNSKSTWIKTWFIGGLLTLLSYATNHHILYFNLYFFIVGLIPLFNSLFKYAEISNKYLTLYYGPFYKRKMINFEWSKISHIGYIPTTETINVSGGSRVWISVKDEYETDAFTIQLLNPVTPEQLEANDKTHKFRLFFNEFKVNESKTDIELKSAPEGGFEKFLHSVSERSKFESKYKEQKSQTLNYAIDILYTLLIFTLIVMPFFIFFIQFPK